MNILIIGSGGREHAIAWKLKQSEYCDKVFVAPGNAGTSEFHTNAAIDIYNFEEVAKFVCDFNIMMVVVGPENVLVEGIHDYFQNSEFLKHVLVVGPKKAGAMLEGSKEYCKAFLQKNNIPTARYQTFTEAKYGEAVDYLRTHSYPAVLKADGLAAGKGVIIAQTFEEALDALEDMLRNKKFGNAGSTVVIEEFLQGIEVSVFILTDSKEYVMLPEAKDYKRIGEGDTGLNTGGMGAVSPVPFADDVFMQKVKERVIMPTLQGMQNDNLDYSGFLFIGLMNVNGEPYVIEYNVRLGDPETEAIIPRISSDLFELFRALHEHKLADYKLEIDPRAATTIFLVSGGYPEGYENGKEITGLDQVESDVLVFHAGTKELNGKVVNNGGRVIAITALGNTIEEALAKANKAAETINWKGRYYRHDIGFDLTQVSVK
ncbi:phosphoribosylamine--glycine ligase [Pontibacter arcticus]|uniref:Phosphoribosylamine--glycine ligase n=1 Tax=Pontibacter arcticus TaxID=2080288 RepID=A0A364RHI5_9BACT|nr:phosphoribosylamine--glycine ligase [Pontibacter arcticus]RAU83743.1 phosphoribosylamine--glycine ligase [Pontibacter arcticus]